MAYVHQLGAREGEKPRSGSCCLSWWVLTRAAPPFQVFCDMETSGGGWTIIQRRKSGLVSFYRDWKQYKQGDKYIPALGERAAVRRLWMNHTREAIAKLGTEEALSTPTTAPEE